MESAQVLVESVDIHQVKKSIEQWRAHKRSNGEAMPIELWSESMTLARVHGIPKIAKALRLDYGALKRRLQRDNTGVESTPFVELTSLPPLVSSPIPSAEHCVEVELLSADESRMVVRASGSQALDLVGLAEVFWRRAAR
jgi:hypothetical protein